MPSTITVPILSDIVPDGFVYGANYLVEFEPDSLWYETSLTIAAHALKHGHRTEYHTYMHMPIEVREALSKMGLNLKELERRGVFRIRDTYTSLTGLPFPGEPSFDTTITAEINKPSYLQDVTAGMVRLIKEGVTEQEKRWLHIDDNTSMFNRYFREQEILDLWQNRIVPLMRIREIPAFHSVMTGIASDAFYKQFESECAGIIDFKGHEEGGRLEQYLRVRSLRGRACDSRWRRLRLLGNGEVAIDSQPLKDNELGIREWLKGPKK